MLGPLTAGFNDRPTPSVHRRLLCNYSHLVQTGGAEVSTASRARIGTTPSVSAQFPPVAGGPVRVARRGPGELLSGDQRRPVSQLVQEGARGPAGGRRSVRTHHEVLPGAIEEIGTTVGDRCDAGSPYRFPAARQPVTAEVCGNTNDKASDDALGIDLLNDPDLVTTGPSAAWRTLLRFWTTPGPARER